jgi:hypothetical protein
MREGQTKSKAFIGWINAKSLKKSVYMGNLASKWLLPTNIYIVGFMLPQMKSTLKGWIHINYVLDKDFQVT